MNGEMLVRKGNGQLRLTCSVTRSAFCCATLAASLALLLSFVSSGNRWLLDSTQPLFEEVTTHTFPRPADNTYWGWR